MIIIAFSENTSKILPRIFCRRFRHCAPIVCNKNNLTMYQFTHHNTIEQIHLHPRDIALLRTHGWKFIYISPNTKTNYDFTHAYSCVDLSKHAIGIHSMFIQTPDSLYKYLTQK